MTNPQSYSDSVVAAVEAAMRTADTNTHALALAVGMSPPTLRRRLHGSPFLLTELEAIANQLGVPVRQLTAPLPVA